jgi:hypothetical protein
VFQKIEIDQENSPLPIAGRRLPSTLFHQAENDCREFLARRVHLHYFIQRDQAKQDKLAMTDLYEALETGNVTAIQEAARAGQNLNLQYKETGDSLLTLAIRHSTREFAQALLAAGCDPNSNKKGTRTFSVTAIIAPYARGDGRDCRPVPASPGRADAVAGTCRRGRSCWKAKVWGAAQVEQ